MSQINSLKLTKVVLFKIGIGSFQKQGTIDLSQSKFVKLSFSNTVMNDLLKTFSILRLEGDLLVAGVSYEAKDTNRNKLLEDSAINLPQDNSFSALIKQLRGINVKLDLKNTSYTGKIIGTQIIKEAPTGQAIIDSEFVLLSNTNGSIDFLKIAEITGLEILDKDVEKDFKYFLETIVGQNKEKNKMVTIFFEGKKNSEYVLNFLQEVPAWKTSYRLFIEEKKETGEEYNFTRNAKIQGWSIIDNVLDEDWEGVDLTLVTGLPVSFIYDSYSPAWIPRPTIERKTDLGVKVVQFDRSVGGALPECEPNVKARKRASFEPERPCSVATPCASVPCPPPKMALDSKMDIAGLAMDMDDAMKTEAYPEEPEPEDTFQSGAEAEGGKGLAFKYHIGTPVFVKRNNSSLIPILQSNITGNIISVYNQSVNPKNPMLTYEFKNDSGLTLEKGPISILIDNIFSGEAMLPFLENGDKCKIPYAVDQAVEIEYKYESESNNYHELDVKEYVYMYYFTTYIYTYTIKNFAEIPKKVIIEHPITSGCELYDTEEPGEKTAKFYRFDTELDPKTSHKLVVKERFVNSTSEYIANINSDFIKDWYKLKLIDNDAKTYLEKRLQLNLERETISSQNNDIDYKINLINEEQARLRENLNALKDSKSEKTLRDKYILKFDERETELEGLQKQKESIKLKLQQIDDQINKLDQDWMVLRTQKLKEKALEKEKSLKLDKEKESPGSKVKKTTKRGGV